MIINQTNIISTNSKLPQVIERTATEITAEDLAGITQIGAYAFYDCDSLTSVTIGNGVTSIGDDAFSHCDSLTSVYYDGDIASWCNISFGNYYANPVYYAKKLYIKKSGTNEYELLTNLVIPNSVTEIKDYAFSHCDSLTSVTIGNRVTSIDKYAFYMCFGLKSITIGGGVKSIGSSAFYGCRILTSVTIPNSVTSIEGDVFRNCYRLTSVTIPSSVTRIGSSSLQIGTSTDKATITFLRTTPPSITASTFNAEYLNKIIVPKGCGEAYKTATNWANFADYIEEAAE